MAGPIYLYQEILFCIIALLEDNIALLEGDRAPFLIHRDLSGP